MSEDPCHCGEAYQTDSDRCSERLDEGLHAYTLRCKHAPRVVTVQVQEGPYLKGHYIAEQQSSATGGIRAGGPVPWRQPERRQISLAIAQS